MRRVAETAAVSPMELPQLNETIDPDALEDLLESVRRPIRGEWPAVAFAYASHRVRITADGRMTVVDSGETPTIDADDWAHVTNVDVATTGDVELRVISALATHANCDPSRVRAAIADVVDLDAVARLSRRRQNGVARTGATVAFSVLGYDVVVGPDGTISVGSTLKRLKRTGGNVLVVGAVPDDLVDVASEKLLGERGRDRRHLFALLDRDVDAVSTRLSPADASAARVVDYAATSRSASSAQPAGDADAGADADANDDADADFDTDTDTVIADEPDDIDALEATIDSSLRALAADESASEPAEVRLCVDSLRPVLEDRDVEGAGRFLESVCESVKTTSALAHFVLPIERASDTVWRLEALFDATVELRVGENGPEQRWHLHEGNYTTEWFTLQDVR